MPNQSNQPRVLAGVSVLILRGNEVLLLKRRGSHGAGTWAPPGGHIDFGETPEMCAIRETREETGLEVSDVAYRCFTNDVFEAERRHYITIWVEARQFSGEASLQAPEEGSEVGWFSWDNLPQPLFLPLANLLAGKTYPPHS